MKVSERLTAQTELDLTCSLLLFKSVEHLQVLHVFK